ncbi:hypothetical protein CROQUDRAFT_101190 [Cronartium quercuum f. sp. fusiforme G11]|uniref:Uncharacterized protein n=1 Tax=Cronartium quercuum f. sp. fusiforme G11 TaxID=708437 RepID=A0A9P6T5T0_9BASI|nr:hypothetical protein CROQUDRAFT_101190 [Cronartium quercuum f. sp. fusiforme G11]
MSLQGQKTTIDLVWANYPLDAKALSTILTPQFTPPPLYHNTASLTTLDPLFFVTSIE